MSINHVNPPIVRHAAYPQIVAEYNKIIERDGKVITLRFYLEFVQPRGIGKSAWYNFVKKYATKNGLPFENISAVPQIVKIPDGVTPAAPLTGETVSDVSIVERVDAPTAIQRGIATALNIGLDSLQRIMSGKAVLSEKEKSELLFKAMKAQDSRINAVARMRKDRRDEVAFDKVFGEAAYSSDGDDAQSHE